MKTAADRARVWVGLAAFVGGLAVIVAAAVLNVLSDRQSAASMPQFLTDLYATSGKTGVTLMLVLLGCTIVSLGLAVPRPRRAPPAPTYRRVAVPLYTPPETNGPEPEVTFSGRVVLRTQKYLGAQHGRQRGARTAERSDRGR
jgi:hypothetical protein